MDPNKLKKLGKILLTHKYRYYELCAPTITDYDYDHLQAEFDNEFITLIGVENTFEEFDSEVPEEHKDLLAIYNMVDYNSLHPWVPEMLSGLDDA